MYLLIFCTSLGYQCPAEYNPSDYYLKIVSEHFHGNMLQSTSPSTGQTMSGATISQDSLNRTYYATTLEPINM